MRRTLRLAGLAALALAGAVATVACAQGAVPASAIEERPSKKRGPPPPPPSITAAGVRYAAIPWGLRRGLDQNGGYLSAADASGRELWVLKVYDTPHAPAMEDDKQDLFIQTLKVVDGGKALLVVDERGGRYRVDLATRTVTRP